MRILVTGASGFIGTTLITYLVSRECEVIALARSGQVRGFSGKCLRWRFGQAIPSSALNGIHCVIHLAHDFNGEQGARLTEKETISCIEALYTMGIRRQVFFSSYSAGEHAKSDYGKSKYRMEKRISRYDGISIVRPGLVLGDGGIYGRIKSLSQKLPIIPLPNGGYGEVPIISVERLCVEVFNIIYSPSVIAESNVFEARLVSLRELALTAAALVGKKPWILPIPGSFFLYSLKLAGALRISLPVNGDNLEGFLANQKAIHTSSLGRYYNDK